MYSNGHMQQQHKGQLHILTRRNSWSTNTEVEQRAAVDGVNCKNVCIMQYTYIYLQIFMLMSNSPLFVIYSTIEVMYSFTQATQNALSAD